MRRLITSSVLALAVVAAMAGSAWAASAPSISSVSPTQVAIGGTLTIKGKNFKKGVKNNRVFFIRSDGKTVRARPSKASSTRQMSVKVPAALDQFLTIKNGVAVATRFHVQVLSGRFSKKTSTSRSPLIFPASSSPTPGTPGTPGTTPPPPPDCDSDGTPDASDADDDNDGLPDTLEAQIGTNACAKDTDGDGVEDGFEYWSAKDLNHSAVPYPGKRPFPNPLDASDAGVDFDQDGLTDAEEFAAWNLTAGRVLPTGDGQTFPYSAGRQDSTAANNLGGKDYDGNGVVTDDEKDADNDGLANWIELAKGSADPAKPDLMKYGFWTKPNLTACPIVGDARWQDCANGLGPIANGNTFTFPRYVWDLPTNWLDPDTDGDTVGDLQDDQDFDGFSNEAEIAAQTNPVDPCANPAPNPTEQPGCQQHP